jgi:hypothetical protein
MRSDNFKEQFAKVETRDLLVPIFMPAGVLGKCATG